LALDLADLVDASDEFILLNKVDINSVAFMYIGDGQDMSVEHLNDINRKVHAIILAEGKYHVHQFSVPDAGIIKKGEIVYPLRFMSGNPNTTKEHLQAMLSYVRAIAQQVETEV